MAFNNFVFIYGKSLKAQQKVLKVKVSSTRTSGENIVLRDDKGVVKCKAVA